MSIRRVRSLVALAVMIAAPATLQAQFGSIIKRARAIRSSVDSAKAAIDTGKTVVRSTKAAVTDATSGIQADSSSASAVSSGDTSKGAGGAHASARVAGPSAAGTTPAPTRRGATPGGARSSSPEMPSAPNTPAATTAAPSQPPAARAAPRSGVTPITEAVYSDFVRGNAAEKAHLKANPDDATGALESGVAASGLSIADYASVHTRLITYTAYATGKNSKQSASLGRLFPAADMAVLNAHRDDIIQMIKK